MFRPDKPARLGLFGEQTLVKSWETQISEVLIVKSARFARVVKPDQACLLNRGSCGRFCTLVTMGRILFSSFHEKGTSTTHIVFLRGKFDANFE